MLIHRLIMGAAATPQSADEGTLIEVLTADDDDGDLSNGTPHCQLILAAFAAQNILLDIACDESASAGSAPCYADFDRSTGPGVLDVFDFLAFQALFVEDDASACDCDTSTGLGLCDVLDFLCFQAAFVTGCHEG